MSVEMFDGHGKYTDEGVEVTGDVEGKVKTIFDCLVMRGISPRDAQIVIIDSLNMAVYDLALTPRKVKS